MLAGERFSDRPASVCPMIAAILRAYNDLTVDRLRADLYRYAADAVGTRADPRLQGRRAEASLAWAASMRAERRRSRRRRRRQAAEPGPEDGPDEIAFYVVSSIARKHTDQSHAAMLDLLDRLIAMAPELGPVSVFRDVVEQLADAVEDSRRHEQLLVAELG